MINPMLAEMLVRDYDREVERRFKRQQLLKEAADHPAARASLRRSFGHALISLGSRLEGANADEVRLLNGTSFTQAQRAEC